ncbi:hypothetical protein BLA29_010160 [Euroglyphus maynei]|uniref:Uncharacterized protein n=1 Tax=Euroglyphus maynei TaxID=6958 RepID=A0A1Y3BSJ8_EURMA|nr:hypothetical protein BLA29_010160 [Euroglyphus maynei]
MEVVVAVPEVEADIVKVMEVVMDLK